LKWKTEPSHPAQENWRQINWSGIGNGTAARWPLLIHPKPHYEF